MHMNEKHPEYQYLDLVKELLENGVKQEDEATGDITHSLFGRQIRFNLEKGFPLLTTKKVYWRGVVEELAWFAHGETNVANLAKNNVHIWDDYPFKIYQKKAEEQGLPEMDKEAFVEKLISDEKFGEEHGHLPRIYGELWRNWPTKDGEGIDQLMWAINEIKRDQDCHNAIVTAWNPEYLYTMAKPENASRFPICHAMYQFNVKDGKVSCQLYQRSADIFLGVPFNIASYALLTHLVAKITGYGVGEFVHTFGDLHVYDTHKAQAEEQISREPRAFPTVSIADDVKTLEDFSFEKVTLNDYDPHPPIKAELAVIGGYYEQEEKKRS